MAKKSIDEDPEKRPLLVYDGDCGFCKRSVERLKLHTGDRVRYVPFQDRENRPSSVSEEEYAEAVHLFLPDQDKPLRAAEAVYRTLKIGNRPALNYLYGKIPWFARISEAAYRFVARRRKAMSRLTLALYGKSLLPSTYRFSSWMFGRAGSNCSTAFSCITIGVCVLPTSILSLSRFSCILLSTSLLSS